MSSPTEVTDKLSRFTTARYFEIERNTDSLASEGDTTTPTSTESAEAFTLMSSALNVQAVAPTIITTEKNSGSCGGNSSHICNCLCTEIGQPSAQAIHLRVQNQISVLFRDIICKPIL